jgi:hypothetical protein
MRVSEFRRAVEQEFGSRYGATLVRDLVLGGLAGGDASAEDAGGLTGEQALAAGVPAREVWLALCREMDVPPERRHGVGLRRPGDTPEDSSRTFVR